MSNWLVVQTKNYSILIGWEQCSSSVTPVQKVYHQCKLYIVILDYDSRKNDEIFCERLICKTITKVLYENIEKSFLECEKLASRKIFQHRVRTGPGKPGKSCYFILTFFRTVKSWNFILTFSRTVKSWKKLLVLESSGNLLNSSKKCVADSKEN